MTKTTGPAGPCQSGANNRVRKRDSPFDRTGDQAVPDADEGRPERFPLFVEGGCRSCEIGERLSDSRTNTANATRASEPITTTAV